MGYYQLWVSFAFGFNGDWYDTHNMQSEKETPLNE